MADSAVPPTEIDCVRVDKVYDFCFSEGTGLGRCTKLRFPAAPEEITCLIKSVNCTVSPPQPLGGDGLAIVQAAVTVLYDVSITLPNGTRLTIVDNTFVFARPVVVCAPAGTGARCRASVTCSCVAIPEAPKFKICCLFTVCLLVEVSAPVRLLIPTYGFCVPAVRGALTG